MAKVIFPPRPKGAIHPNDLDYYEKTGLWIAQYKYNGARILIHINEGNVIVWTRHASKHLTYTLFNEVKNEFLSLPGLEKDVEYWLDGEVLTKTTSPETKNKIILFDILHKGKYLFLKPNQMIRLEMLNELCGRPDKLDCWCKMGYQISTNLLLAPIFTNNFKVHFNELKCDEVEGVVLRKKDSVLDNFGQKEYEVGWLIRCRQPHKNYNF